MGLGVYGDNGDLITNWTVERQFVISSQRMNDVNIWTKDHAVDWFVEALKVRVPREGQHSFVHYESVVGWAGVSAADNKSPGTQSQTDSFAPDGICGKKHFERGTDFGFIVRPLSKYLTCHQDAKIITVGGNRQSLQIRSAAARLTI